MKVRGLQAPGVLSVARFRNGRGCIGQSDPSRGDGVGLEVID